MRVAVAFLCLGLMALGIVLGFVGALLLGAALFLVGAVALALQGR